MSICGKERLIGVEVDEVKLLSYNVVGMKRKDGEKEKER